MSKSHTRLGQHFLVSPQALALVLQAAGRDPRGTVLEIGAGRGALTFALAPRFGRVIAVEKDRLLAADLAAAVDARRIVNVAVVPGDIRDLFPEGLPLPPQYAVVANIPYYLTGQIVRDLLSSPRRPDRAVLMVQREVALRLAAAPPRMNLLALAAQCYGRVRIAGFVSRRAFRPEPRVDSAVIVIDRISPHFFSSQKVGPEELFRVASSAFRAKRKTLANGLAAIAGGKPEARRALARAGLIPEQRPEELRPADWARIARSLR